MCSGPWLLKGAETSQATSTTLTQVVLAKATLVLTDSSQHPLAVELLQALEGYAQFSRQPQNLPCG